MKKLGFVAALIFAALLASAGAAPAPNINFDVGICDPLNPQNCWGPANYAHITTETTTVVKSGPGILQSVCVNTGAASSTITIDDATSATTPTIAVLSGATPGCFGYNVAFSTGLTIVTAVGTPDITVSYR